MCSLHFCLIKLPLSCSNVSFAQYYFFHPHHCNPVEEGRDRAAWWSPGVQSRSTHHRVSEVFLGIGRTEFIRAIPCMTGPDSYCYPNSLKVLLHCYPQWWYQSKVILDQCCLEENLKISPGGFFGKSLLKNKYFVRLAGKFHVPAGQTLRKAINLWLSLCEEGCWMGQCVWCCDSRSEVDGKIFLFLQFQNLSAVLRMFNRLESVLVSEENHCKWLNVFFELLSFVPAISSEALVLVNLSWGHGLIPGCAAGC